MAITKTKICASHNTQLKQQLKDYGLKVTPARLDILDVLSHTKKPISIHDLSALLPHLDLATIYRNCENLKNLGILNQVDLQHGHAHYEISNRAHHHHLICRNCGQVADISKCDMTNLEKQALKLSGFATITSHSLEFYGYCKVCQASKM